jgi:hypothetical protein
MHRGGSGSVSAFMPPLGHCWGHTLLAISRKSPPDLLEFSDFLDRTSDYDRKKIKTGAGLRLTIGPNCGGNALVFLVIALVTALAPPVERVSIYVGPNVRDGFVDIDKGVQDSIEDLQKELRGNRSLRVVPDESSATLKLYVASRSKYATGDSVVTGTGSTTSGVSTGSGVSVEVEGYRLKTVLRAGDYERVFTGESEWRWKGCARSIAKDLAIWLDANRERVSALE